MDVINVDFNLTTTPTDSNMVFGQSSTASFPSSLHAAYSTYITTSTITDSNQNQKYGDIFFNHDYSGGWSILETDNTPSNNSDNLLKLGSFQFGSVLHEIGHSLGLQHTHDVNDISGTSLDNEKYSIMAYNPHGHLYHTDGSLLRASGLQIMDIYNLQEIYGREYGTRSGNTNYTAGFGLGESGISTSTEAFMTTIWDGGGIDTISAEGFSDHQAKIDLRQGHFSSIGSDGNGGSVF